MEALGGNFEFGLLRTLATLRKKQLQMLEGPILPSRSLEILVIWWIPVALDCLPGNVGQKPLGNLKIGDLNCRCWDLGC